MKGITFKVLVVCEGVFFTYDYSDLSVLLAAPEANSLHGFHSILRSIHYTVWEGKVPLAVRQHISNFDL